MQHIKNNLVLPYFHFAHVQTEKEQMIALGHTTIIVELKHLAWDPLLIFTFLMGRGYSEVKRVPHEGPTCSGLMLLY